MWSRRGFHRGATAIALATAGLLVGCGDDPTGPEGTGSVQAYVEDESSGAPAGSDAPAAAGPNASSHGSGSYSGSLMADARVSIFGDGGVWVDLGPPSSLALALQASNHRVDVHGRAEIPVGVYTRVRLTLTGAQARLDAGGAIGGVTLTASTTLTVGAGGTVIIEKDVPPFEVRVDTHTTITWGVNSHLWVHEENVEDEQVEEQEVDDASDVRADTAPRQGDMV